MLVNNSKEAYQTNSTTATHILKVKLPIKIKEKNNVGVFLSNMQPMKIPVHKILSCFTVLASVFNISFKNMHVPAVSHTMTHTRPDTLSDNA